MVDIQDQADYWNLTWNGRIQNEHSVAMNKGKIIYLLKELWKRAYLAPLEKLDIGCGTGIHAIRLSLYNPLWRSKWTGVDLSQKAIDFARAHDLNAFCASIFDFPTTDKKYSAFLLLDSLEHFEDTDLLAQRIMELADDEYLIIGNVPLYLSKPHEKGGVEYPINIKRIKEFLIKAGCKKTHILGEVYGIMGMPYMLFETSNTNRDFSRWCQ